MNTRGAHETLRETAAAWHDRLRHEKAGEPTRRAFAAWLAESPDHQRAYEAIERTWAALQASAQVPEILAMRHEAALRLTRGTSRNLRPLRWAAAAAVVLGLGAVMIAAYSRGGLAELGKQPILSWLLGTGANGTYTTAVGERLVVTLNDGSQVTIDTQSELRVAFSKAERDVQLVRGQALFEVAKDRLRPFVVAARDRHFVAVGTAFDVRLDNAQIRVTMIEGTVRVERSASSGGLAAHGLSTRPRVQPASSAVENALSLTPIDTSATMVTTLTAGEQLLVDARNEDHVRTTDPDRATSWRLGQIIFDNTRLADAAAELNRYSETKIVLGNPALANLRISGAFATGRPNVFIEALTSYFPVAVASSDDRAIVLTSR